MAATAVYILNPEMRDKSIPQIADEMQLGLEAMSLLVLLKKVLGRQEYLT